MYVVKTHSIFYSLFIVFQVKKIQLFSLIPQLKYLISECFVKKYDLKTSML